MNDTRAQEQRLESIRHQIDQTKTERIQAETRIESYQREVDRLLEKCQELGLDPNNLEETIKTLSNQVERDLNELERIVNGTEELPPAPPAQAWEQPIQAPDINSGYHADEDLPF